MKKSIKNITTVIAPEKKETRGRKPSADPKQPVRTWIFKSYIETIGGEEATIDFIYKAVEEKVLALRAKNKLPAKKDIQKTYHDMRGTAFSANFIVIIKDKPYYAGQPVKAIQPSPDTGHRSRHFYDIIGVASFQLGTIALRDIDKKEIDKLLVKIK